MGMHEERHGKEVVLSEFPPGLRVLAIDNDPVSLKVLEVLLRMRNYRPTIARDTMAAIRMLREGRNNFDLVISDVYMSYMDGFNLLKLINLEMDLPVIVLSADERPEAKKKCIAYGACEYLVKPLQTKHLDIMWRHVMARRTPDARRFSSSIGNAAAEKARPTGGAAAGGEQDGAKSTEYGWTTSHEHDGDGHDANEENVSLDPSIRKKPRTAWRNALQDKFVEAVSQIGIKRAVPSKILAAMNVDNVSRESIASHLQKYRMYLGSAEHESEKRRNLLFAERWNVSREEGIKYFKGNGIYRPSANPTSWNPTSLPTRMDHPSTFGARGVGVNGGSMLFRDTVPWSSSLLRGVRQWPSSSSSRIGSRHSRGKSSYMGMLRGNLLGANSGGFFADRNRNRGIHQFSVQPSRQLRLQPLVQRTTYGDTRNCLGNSCQAAMKYPDLSRDYWNWRRTPGPSQANIPNINQPTGLVATPAGQIVGQVPMSLDELQNQISAFINTTSSMAGSGEEMASFDVDVAINNNNTGSGEILNGNFAIDGNTSSVEMLNGDVAIEDNTSWVEMVNEYLAIDDNTSSVEMLNGDFPIDDNTNSVEMPNGNFLINNNISSVEMPNGHFTINDNMSSVDMPNGNVAINNNTSSVEMLNGNSAINNNTSSVEMLNGNFALGSASSVSAAIPDLQMDISAGPTQMLNDGGAGGVLPSQAQGTANQEAVDGQLNIDSDDFWEAVNERFSMDNIFTTTNMLNEDLLINDVNNLGGDL